MHVIRILTTDAIPIFHTDSLYEHYIGVSLRAPFPISRYHRNFSALIKKILEFIRKLPNVYAIDKGMVCLHGYRDHDLSVFLAVLPPIEKRGGVIFFLPIRSMPSDHLSWEH